MSSKQPLPNGDLRYDNAINLNEKNSSHYQLYEMLLAGLAPASHVLEVGCATGRMGALIKQQGHKVTGIELNSVSAAEAKLRLDDVFVGSVEAFLESRDLSQFDAVMMGDVLEHLPNPEAVLQALVNQLSADACLVLSVPNVAHGAVRAALLAGSWEYSSVGLLDSTHLRFFTFSGLLQTLARAGWCAEVVNATYQDMGVVNQHYRLGATQLSMQIVSTLVCPKDIDVFQLIVLARPSNPQRLVGHQQFLADGGVVRLHRVQRKIKQMKARVKLALALLSGQKL